MSVSKLLSRLLGLSVSWIWDGQANCERLRPRINQEKRLFSWVLHYLIGNALFPSQLQHNYLFAFWLPPDLHCEFAPQQSSAVGRHRTERLESESALWRQQALEYHRGFLSVGAYPYRNILWTGWLLANWGVVWILQSQSTLGYLLFRFLNIFQRSWVLIHKMGIKGDRIRVWRFSDVKVTGFGVVQHAKLVDYIFNPGIGRQRQAGFIASSGPTRAT